MIDYQAERQAQTKRIVRSVLIGVAVFFGLIVIFGSLVGVDAGERKVVLHLGKVDRILDPGMHFKAPLIESAIVFEVKTQKVEAEASAASKDLQTVTTNVALQFGLVPESVGLLYEEVGVNYKARIIDPAIQDAIKAVTAKYNAEELITKREVVRDEIKTLLSTRLQTSYVIVENVDIINFDFSEEFNSAIEAKVTAQQNAQKAENDLARVEFEAQQTIEQAKAQAESIRIQAEAITSQGGADYVKLKAIEKWNGSVPQTMIPGATVPFIDLNNR